MATTSKAALIPEAKAKLEIRELEVPTLKPNEVLVKVNSIALNPVDWKIQDTGFYANDYPYVPGSDISGSIIAKGDGAPTSRFSIGDHVTGYANSLIGFGVAHGAFQTHVILQAENTARLPASMSWNEGSTYPMAVATAGLGIWDELQIPRPVKGQKSAAKSNEAVLVWGGSSSVGAAAVQMAAQSGYSVYTTASASHSAWLQKIGAKAVFDYRDAAVSSQITKAAAQDGIKVVAAFDAIAEGEGESHSSLVSAKIVESSNGGGRLVGTLPLPEGLKLPEGVQVTQMFAAMVGTAKKEFGTWLFNEWLEEVLQNGSLVPGVGIKTVGQGVESLQEAMDVLQKGVSGTKVVVPLA